MSPPNRAVLAIAAGLLLISVVIDFMPARMACGKDPVPRYEGRETFTINGVRVGGGSDQLVGLGPPDRTTEQRRTRVLQGTRRTGLSVVTTLEGEVIEVFGSTLEAGERVLAHGGLSQEEIEQILGPGKVQTHRNPSGSGIISIGWKETGRTMTYENGGVRIEFELHDDSLRSVRAFKPQP